jgi:hypothetical protein
MLICLLSAGCLTGCSSDAKFETVTGAVTLDGKPIEQGTISFESMSAGGAVGRRITTAIREGKYRFEAADGPNTGRHKVFISAFRELSASTAPAGKAGKGEQFVRDSTTTVRQNYIPEKYNKKSSLTVEVASEPDENGEQNVNVDFELKSK